MKNCNKDDCIYGIYAHVHCDDNEEINYYKIIMTEDNVAVFYPKEIN